MISSQEIRSARERAGLTQQQLGEMVGVGLRTVGNWERGETVPRNREATLRRVLAGHLDDASEPAVLRAVADAEIVAEVARRMSRTQERTGELGVHTAATTPAGSAPAELDPTTVARLQELRRQVGQRIIETAASGGSKDHRRALVETLWADYVHEADSILAAMSSRDRDAPEHPDSSSATG